MGRGVVIGSGWTRMSDNDDSLPRLLGGRYRLEAKLGSGGMGVVYRATDLTMHRSVAVKLIRGIDGVALDEEVAGRFLREAKNTARVQHENIIEVYDLGRSDQGDMYFVMELLEGESLSTKLRRDGKIAPAVTVHIARQMCAALHVAHSAGIIHRDLKPANVMLVRRGNDSSYVKVLDFGVAKSYTPDQQTQLTHTGMLVGTVEYMAPEQIMGRQVDGRTDLYALGVVMYRMLTGKPPFRDGGVPALIHAHLNVFPKPMSELKPEISGALDRVILRCLAKQPEQRYESMEELSRALAAAMEPPARELVNLEYASDDPYDQSDKTEVARPPQRIDTARPRAGGAPAPSSRLDEAFDDATIKMDRPERPDQDGGPGSLPRRLPRVDPLDDSGDRTAVMARDVAHDESTAKRPVPDEVKRFDAGLRECAMCRTKNAPHARACSACGVSLASEDQEAVRARVTAPRTAHMPAPHMPPPTSGAYPAPPFGRSPAQVQGMPIPPVPHSQPQMQQLPPRQSYPSVNWQAPPHAPKQNASVWQRFLKFTGLG